MATPLSNQQIRYDPEDDKYYASERDGALTPTEVLSVRQDSEGNYYIPDFNQIQNELSRSVLVGGDRAVVAQPSRPKISGWKPSKSTSIGPEATSQQRMKLYDDMRGIMMKGLKAGATPGEIWKELEKYGEPAARTPEKGYSTFASDQHPGSVNYYPPNPARGLWEEIGNRQLTQGEIDKVGSGELSVYNPPTSTDAKTEFSGTRRQSEPGGFWENNPWAKALASALVLPAVGALAPLAVGAGLGGFGAAGGAGTVATTGLGLGAGAGTAGAYGVTGATVGTTGLGLGAGAGTAAAYGAGAGGIMAETGLFGMTTKDWIGLGVKAGGSLVGGYFDQKAAETSAEGATEAGRLQLQATREALALQEKMYLQGREDIAPWREAGGKALGTLAEQVSAGPGEFVPEEQPGYEFGAGQLLKEYTNRFGEPVLSGQGLIGLGKEMQGYASQQYDSFLNRYYASLNPLQSLAGVGQTSAGQSAGMAQQAGAQQGQLILGGGQAQASAVQGAAYARGTGYQNIGNRIGETTGGISQDLILGEAFREYLRRG
ncbi:hypothetical protein LCGC14_1469470 [marine sediment metagenome]|uniref:Uncharacterized protein n=1 Tax=marine sediment metagenome TaxID=412755 RepID=A0A0F9LT67_9ZZZZ